MSDSIFDKFSEEELLKILAVSENKSFNPGEIIFKQDENPDSIYIVRDGEISLVKIGDTGEDTELTKIGRGSFLGEISVLDEGAREISAIAVSDVKAFKIPVSKLKMMEKFEKKLLVKFYLSVIKDVNKRLRRANEEYSKLKEELSREI
ncbi:MAG: cyclic nucleotide-binding domain-containing protein [Candidatus Muiribacteriota bacterium]|jgi:CRP-like cAMP-binding protein